MRGGRRSIRDTREYRASERAQSTLTLSPTGSRQLSEVTQLETMLTQHLSWNLYGRFFLRSRDQNLHRRFFMLCLEERHERHERRREKHKRHERVQSERESTKQTQFKSNWITLFAEVTQLGTMITQQLGWSDSRFFLGPGIKTYVDVLCFVWKRDMRDTRDGMRCVRDMGEYRASERAQSRHKQNPRPIPQNGLPNTKKGRAPFRFFSIPRAAPNSTIPKSELCATARRPREALFVY